MPKKVIEDLKRRMEGAMHALQHDLKGLRTGRANVALLDTIAVEVYGSRMPLNQVATINVPEARLITVQVWDKANAPLVEKAIMTAGLGLNPVTEGQVVRVPLPDLSEERRRELVKVSSQYGEKARIAVRNVRRDGMEDLKKKEKAGDISEDEHRKGSDEVQKLTDDYTKQIDAAVAKKEKDIMEG